MHNHAAETPISWRHRGITIITDPYKSERPDAVFPLYREPFYLVDSMKVPKGGLVLDLCTGCGIIAIFAAKKAGRVIATDINPRALSMARFNAAMNGVDDKIEFRQGDMFEPVKGLLFDLITANPPYQMKRETWTSEKSLTKYILENANKHLNPEGSLQIICYVPDEALYILDSLKERFKKVKVVHLNREAIRAKKRHRDENYYKERYDYENYLFVRASARKDNF